MSDHASGITAGRSLRVVVGLATLGAILVLGSSVAWGSLEPTLLPFLAWGLAPYGLLLVLGRAVPNPWVAAGAGLLAIAVEVGVRLGVFVYPTGSTSAIALVFSPILVALALPVGGACGGLFGWVWRRSGALVRGLASAPALVGLGLVVLAFGRPDLTPWAVADRKAALDRIGPPRVVVGGESFRRERVSEARAWFQTTDLDGEPGDEVAVLRHRGVTLLEPVTFREVGRVELSSAPLLSWYSVLARLDGRVVVVQTGGGYQETELRETGGELIWRHRPDPALPPSALRPADLDGDGRLELYAAEGDSVARLDGAGRVVWREPATYGGSLRLSEPRTGEEPAWVASVGVDSLTVWDETGHRIAERKLAGGPAGSALAALGDERLLWRGGETLRGETLSGEVRCELPLGDFTFASAVSVRLAPGAGAHLAVTAQARGLDLWRLLVVSPDGDVAYDEVIGHSVQPLVARSPGAADVLLVSGEGLSVVRPQTAAPQSAARTRSSR